MLEYAEQITRDATRITPAFHDRLRAEGFDDRGILQIADRVVVQPQPCRGRVGVGRDPLPDNPDSLWLRSPRPGEGRAVGRGFASRRRGSLDGLSAAHQHFSSDLIVNCCSSTTARTASPIEITLTRRPCLTTGRWRMCFSVINAMHRIRRPVH